MKVLKKKKNLTKIEKQKVAMHRNRMWFFESLGLHGRAKKHYDEIFKITHDEVKK